MAQWQGRSAGNRFGYGIFIFILKKFGLLPAYFILRFVAFYFFLFSTKSNRAIRKYFRDILGYAWFRSVVSTYRNYYNLGQTIIDKVVVMSGMRSPFTFEFDGEENLHRLAQSGKGGLLISAHLGNYEIAGHLLKRLNTTINLVMFDGEQAQIKEYLEKVAGKRNMNVILIKNDISHIYAINEALQRQEIVCMHADRFVEGNKTISTNFLNHPAPFPIGPFVLASTFKLPVCFVYAFKDSYKHYHLYASPVTTYATANRNENIQRMLQDFVATMEEKISKYPLQWYNYYDFWQALPSDVLKHIIM